MEKTIRYRITVFLLLFLLGMGITACSREPAIYDSLSGIPEEPPVFLGTWEAARYVDGLCARHGNLEKMGSVEHLIGKEIYFGADQVTVDGVICESDPKYEITVHPIDELKEFSANGWMFKEGSRQEFFGDNSTYFTFVTTLPDEQDLVSSPISLFIKDQNTMVAQMNAGAVELKRVGELPQEKLPGKYRDAVYLAGYGGEIAWERNQLIYAGEWEVVYKVYGIHQEDEDAFFTGERFVFSNEYVETDLGFYTREGMPGKGDRRLYEINVCPDSAREKYIAGHMLDRDSIWTGGEDYFVVVKMADDLVKEDDYLGELLITDAWTMYLYNRYGLFELSKTGNVNKNRIQNRLKLSCQEQIVKKLCSHITATIIKAVKEMQMWMQHQGESGPVF